MRRVLITGGAGFVGGHLIELATGHGAEIMCVARREPAAAAISGVRFEQLDLRDSEATAAAVEGFRPDWVFHLAAQSSPALSWEHPVETIDANVKGTASVLEATATGAPGARLLLAGSGDQYGQVEASELPISEEREQRPRNPYALSKVAADLLGRFYTEIRGLDIVRTRAFNHFGPGQALGFAVADFAHQIAAAEARGDRSLTLSAGDLSARRDFTDVRDIVRAYWSALTSAPAGVYNVCTGRSIQLSDIVDRLVRLSEIEVVVGTDPKRLRPADVREAYGSVQRLTEATGWKPEIPLDETLKETLDWWRLKTTSAR